jgi:hypothetical protein
VSNLQGKISALFKWCWAITQAPQSNNFTAKFFASSPDNTLDTSEAFSLYSREITGSSVAQKARRSFFAKND